MDFFLQGHASDSFYIEARDTNNDDALNFRNNINIAWNKFKHIINDGNFLNNAKSNLWGAAWHLRLLDFLDSHGYHLFPTGSGQPDIKIQHDGITVWIEAISASNGNGGNEIRTPKGVAYTPDWDRIVLRIRNALDQKSLALGRYIDGNIVGPSDKCVIAVNSVRVPDSSFWFHDLDNEITRTLFGLGNLLSTIDVNTLQVKHEEFSYEPTITHPATGRVVDNHFFRLPEHSRISAVIFSPFRPFYGTSQHIQFIHNPNTTRPISHGFLKIGKEVWVEQRTPVIKQWL